jgi:transcription initiation factor TFIIIB Brf1 subunit/transcription initiation factor TFIIB
MNTSRGRKCPHCGEAGTQQVDYQRGEVACTACATVTQMCLVEDEMTVFDEDTTGIALDSIKSRGFTAGGKANDLSPEERANLRAFGILRGFADRAALPETVLNLAQSYYERYAAVSRTRSVGGFRQPLLAAVCVMLAGARWKHPMQTNEALFILKSRNCNASAAQLDELRRKVVRDLALKASVDESAKTIYDDLCRMQLQRVALPAAGAVPQMAAAMAATFTDEVASGRNPAVICAAMLVVAHTHRGALAAAVVLDGKEAEAERGEKWPSTRDDAHMFHLVVQASREEQSSVRALLQSLTPANVNRVVATGLASVQTARRAPQPAAAAPVATLAESSAAVSATDDVSMRKRARSE